jgi:hypothetical protein
MMKVKNLIQLLGASAILFLSGCCMDDMNCGGSNTYVPVSSCYSCSSPCSRPVVSTCKPSCTVCGYDGSYAYTSWY